MKHTKGEWERVRTSTSDQVVVYGREIKYTSGNNNRLKTIIAEFPISETSEANAKLIAAAGTVANETGYTPRQLADQRKGLLKALNEYITRCEVLMEYAQLEGKTSHLKLLGLLKIKGREAIKKATE